MGNNERNGFAWQPEFAALAEWHALVLRAKGFLFMHTSQCTMARPIQSERKTYADVAAVAALSRTSVVRKQGDDMVGIPAVTRLRTLPSLRRSMAAHAWKNEIKRLIVN